MGRCGILSVPMATSQHFVNYICGPDLDPEYLLLTFRWPMQWEFQRLTMGSTLRTIGLPDVDSFRIALPPIDEQREIVTYVQEQRQRHDTIICSLSSAISTLQECRSAIISAAVTGTIVVQRTGAPTQTQKANPYFRRAVLAANIVHQLQGDSNLGRTKLQKLLYLSEHHAQLADLQSNYFRKAAGPYDSQMMHSVESQLAKQRWYKCETGTGGECRYVPLEAAGQHARYFDRYWGVKSEPIRKLVALLKRADTRQTEIVATLYAAWNDLLLAGQSVTDEAILHEVLEKWHEEKRQIPEKRWRNAIAWMRQRDLIPTGFGQPTRQKPPRPADGE